MTFLPSPALAKGIKCVTMSQPGRWLCRFVGRRRVPSDGGERCGSCHDDVTI